MQIIYKEKNNQKILECGCGTGRWIELFSSLTNNDFVGIEPSINMYKIARMRLKANDLVHLHNQSIESYCQQNIEKFDLILLLHVLPFVDNDFNTLNLLRKNLKTGGKLVFTVQNFYSMLNLLILSKNTKQLDELLNHSRGNVVDYIPYLHCHRRSDIVSLADQLHMKLIKCTNFPSIVTSGVREKLTEHAYSISDVLRDPDLNKKILQIEKPVWQT